MSLRKGPPVTLAPPVVIEKEAVRSPLAVFGQWEGFAAAAFYGLTSIFITFSNKATFLYGSFPNTLSAAQMVISLVLLLCMRRCRFVSFPNFDVATARIVFPMVFYFIAMVVTGLAALFYMNVSLYGAVRRLTTWIVMVSEQLILRKSFPLDEQLSVYGMVGGAFVAGWDGHNAPEMMGYVLVLLNCVVTALYLVYIPKKQTESGLNTFGLMFYNNLMSLPFVLILVFYLEWDIVKAFVETPAFYSLHFWWVFGWSAALGFLLNYSIFLCSTVNSPLVTSITGQIKNLAQTLLGLFWFDVLVFTPLFLGGLFVSTVASVFYGWVKYDQSARRKAAQVAASALEEGKGKPSQ